MLKRLRDLKLLTRLDRRIGGQRAGSAGFVYSLSPLGHRILGTPTRHRHREPSFGFVAHTLAIAELATSLIEYAWRHHSDKLSGWHIQTEPAAWRTFHGELHPVILKPDLALRLTNDQYELHWFVEVDLGTESSLTIQRKCQRYTSYWRTGIEQATHGLFPRTLWVAPDQRRVDQIERTIQAGAQIEPQLFAVTPADQAITVLTTFDDEEP